jgi:hypothetical protein
MTKKDKKPSAAEDAAADVAAIDKKREKKARESEIVDAGKSSHDGFDLVGRVESVRVAGDGPGRMAFQFTLKGKGNRDKAISLDSADAQVSAAMAEVVMTAAKLDAKLAVRFASSGDGPRFATVLEIRF